MRRLFRRRGFRVWLLNFFHDFLVQLRLRSRWVPSVFHGVQETLLRHRVFLGHVPALHSTGSGVGVAAFGFASFDWHILHSVKFRALAQLAKIHIFRIIPVRFAITESSPFAPSTLIRVFPIKSENFTSIVLMVCLYQFFRTRFTLLLFLPDADHHHDARH